VRGLAFVLMVGGGMMLLPVMLWVAAYLHTWSLFLALLMGL